MTKLSVHISSGNRSGFGDWLQRTAEAQAAPAVIYTVNENIRADLDRFSPATRWIYRYQTDEFNRLPPGFFEGDPIENATIWLTKTRDVHGRTLIENWQLNPADWFDPLNEPVPDIPSKAAWFDRWMQTALQIAHEHGFKLAYGSFSTGAPELSVLPFMQPSLRTAKQYGAVLSLHAYWGSADPNADPSNALRYRDIQAALPTDCQLPIVISEASPGNGYDPSDPITGSQWVTNLAKYDVELIKDNYVLSACGFQLGGDESNCVKVLPALGDSMAERPNTTPPPPINPPSDGVNYVVTVHLVPPANTPSEKNTIDAAADPLRQSVVYSADDAKRLVVPGQPGSKVIVWQPDRWPGDIVAYLAPAPVEIRTFVTTPPPPIVTPPPAGHALRGLHLRADGGSTDLDFQCLTVAKLNAAKIMTNTSFEEFTRVRSMVPVANIVLRLFAAGDNPALGNPARFFDEQRAWLAEFNARGGRYVEIHNEPNLPQEGCGQWWHTGRDYAAFHQNVALMIRSQFPALKIGYAGLSPNTANEPDFMAQIRALIAAHAIDWIGAHSYWVNGIDMNVPANGRHYRLSLQYGLPVIITEFANVGTSDPDHAKGDQYKAYYASLEAGVLAAHAFVSSASDPGFNQTRQTWVRDDRLTAIPAMIGL